MKNRSVTEKINKSSWTRRLNVVSAARPSNRGIAGQLFDRLRGQAGSSSIEFALVLPVLVTILVAAFQIGIAYNNYLAITHAAREGVRQASVGRFDEAAVRADAYPVNPTAVSLAYPEGRDHGLPVVVTVRYDLPFSIPFFGERIIPLVSQAEMRSEVQ